MVDEIAKRKFDRAENAEGATVEGALNACLADHKDKKFTSVLIMAIPTDANPDTDPVHTYVAGPEFSTYQKVWLRLQKETLWLIAAICGNN